MPKQIFASFKFHKVTPIQNTTVFIFIFSALNKLEKSIQFGKLAFISAYVSIWRGNKVSFIFVLLQDTIRSHIKHTIIFLG